MQEDAGNSDMPKRSCKVLPFSEKLCLYGEKHSMHKVWNYLRFPASTGRSWNIPPMDNGETAVKQYITSWRTSQRDLDLNFCFYLLIIDFGQWLKLRVLVSLPEKWA